MPKGHDEVNTNLIRSSAISVLIFHCRYFGVIQIMATSAQQVIVELKQVQKYLGSQRTLLGEAAMQQQADVWAMKLQHTVISAHEAVDVVNEIKTGPWNESQQKDLGMAVNTSVLANSAADRVRRANQDLNDFTKYLSAGDLKVLADPNVPSQRKLEQVACRMRRLGLHLPSELTVRHIFAVSLKAGLQCQKDPTSLSTTMRELKRILKVACKNAPRSKEHVVKYPSSPEELPRWLFQEAYDENDPPQSIDISTAEVAGQAAAVALRKNSKLLPQNQQHMQTGMMVSGGQPVPQDPLAAIQMMFMGMIQMFQGQAQQLEVPSLELMKPKEKIKALPCPMVPPAPAQGGVLALTNGSSSATGPATPAVEPTTPAKSAVSEPMIETPAPKALSLPTMSPESQVKAVAAATSVRKDARLAAKENEESQVAKAKAKAKCKAKAKATAKGKAKATKTEPKSEAIAPEAVPPIMKKGDPTVYYRGGKVHRNTDCFRVFVKASDRCDRKVRIWEGQEQECWLKAIGIIDARLDATDLD